MSSPINILLDEVEWESIEGTQGDDSTPYATHSGTLKLGNTTLRVYQLNDGRRVIEESDLTALFGSLLPFE